MARSNFYDNQRATVNVGHELRRRGWKLYGYSEDKSDSQTDYWHPASWDGIATHDAYPGVVFVMNVSDYTARKSGKDEVRTRTEPGATCETCAGTGMQPRAISLQEAKKQPDKAHIPPSTWTSIGGMVVTTVDSMNYHPDGSPRCTTCRGRGHHLEQITEKLFTWPTFRANARGRAWHVESNGQIIASGTGFAKCAEYGTRGEQAAKAVCDEVEAAAKRACAPHSVQAGSDAATTTSTGELPTVASAGGVTVRVDFDAKGWTYIKLEPRIDRTQYDAFAARFNVHWHRVRRMPVIYRPVGADELAAFFAPAAAAEPQEDVPAETMKAITEAAAAPEGAIDHAPEPAPEAPTEEQNPAESQIVIRAEYITTPEYISAGLERARRIGPTILNDVQRYQDRDKPNDPVVSRRLQDAGRAIVPGIRLQDAIDVAIWAAVETNDERLTRFITGLYAENRVREEEPKPVIAEKPATTKAIPSDPRTHFHEEFYDADWGSVVKARKAAHQRAEELRGQGWKVDSPRRSRNDRYIVSAYDPGVPVYTSVLSLGGLQGEGVAGETWKSYTRRTPADVAPVVTPSEAPADPMQNPTPTAIRSAANNGPVQLGLF